ncbi:hypothetical protein [Aureimonas sp. AU12]|uniref:hypothetical protein n=1 Tax=Aureimonas sp. AU12 TaxID=1638161 RepID=UPI00078155D7|nr:hypothetical protein [Aureimonas sp. AU12]
MPIKPEMRGFYPIDWEQLSASIRFRRANGRCEQCKRPHKRLVCQLTDGRWYDDEAQRWRDEKGRGTRANLPSPERLPSEIPARYVYVVIACAHLDHDVANNDAANLRALCQRCHLAHDRPRHRTQRWLTWRASKAIGDLFTGRYR